jgi:DNA-binding transcriptional MerR regulator
VSTHTIGEVLNRLKGEFDDITISKIRFLEAKGLISPDRTESGFRKFTEDDVDRLRYVLRAQRDRYLPLTVIKEELERIDAGLTIEDAAAATSGGIEATGADGGDEPSAAQRSLLDAGPSDVLLSVQELASASGLTEAQVEELRYHQLLGPGPSYAGDDLRVCKLAGDLLGNGLEVRHLRMYRQFAEREASLIEQLVAPLLRQRNPDSRKAATQTSERLALVGGELHKSLLAVQLRTLLRS